MKKTCTFLSCIMATFLFFFLSVTNINAQISGTHYIGLTDEYTTIQAAVDSLVSQGVNGPVEMIIRTGYYPEQIEILPITGASGTNTITFRSETLNPEDVFIYYDATTSTNNYVIYFNEADYVTFSHLKIANATISGSYTRVVAFNGTAEHNKLLNNTLIGKGGAPTGASESIIQMYREIVSYTEIANNLFQGGSYAIRFDISNFDTERSTYVKINNNVFETYGGVFLEAQDYVEVIGNEINSNMYDAIYLNNCSNNIKIVGNKIKSYYEYGHDGINLINCAGSIAFQGLISNNVIITYDEGGNNDLNTGIYLSGSSYQNIYHNTINLRNCATTGAGIKLEGGSSINVRNNLVSVEKNGYAIANTVNTNVVASDYNNFYSAGNYLANWNNSKLAELSDLKTANGKDANSLSIYPSFVANDQMDGLVPQTHWLNNGGTNLSSVVDYDVDSVSRPATPDMGAFEFTPNNTMTYSGIYSIGPAGDFTSFSAAADSLKKLGVSGPVILNVENNTYTEQFVLPEIPGLDASKPIVFQSASGDSSLVTLQFTPSTVEGNYVVKLEGADYITFKQMTMKSFGTTYSKIIDFEGRSHDITITNNRFNGNGNAADTETRTTICAEGDLTNNLTITNNSFSGGDKAIYLEAVSDTELGENLLISGNYSVGYQDAFEIRYHTNLNIADNLIEDFTSSGIYTYICYSPYTIQRNRVFSTSTSYYGIQAYKNDGSGAGGTIMNNFVYLQGTNVFGIRIYDAGFVNVYNNSVSIESSDINARALFYDYSNSHSNIRIKNNNFYVNGPGYPMYVESPEVVISECDYNNYFTSGTYVARWGADYYTDIPTMSTATGYDNNSVKYNPSYVGTTDLHSNSYWLDNAGTPIAEVTVDIDGEPRNGSTPDIGADEFTSTNKPYAGSYTIGNGGYFESITEAVDSLIEMGVSDSVHLKILNGNYLEQVAIPEIANTSITNHIVFESNSGNAADVVISYNPTSTNNYIINLEGVDYLSFKNLTFDAGSDSYARVFSFQGQCEYHTYSGNIFIGRSENTNSDYDAIFYCDENTPILNNITITNNTFQNGAFGVYFRNYSNTRGADMQIVNNEFATHHCPVYLEYFTSPVVSNNQVTFFRTDGIGIYLKNINTSGSDNIWVTNNRIYADVATNASTSGGILLYYSDGTSLNPIMVLNNTIRIGINNSYRSIGLNIYSTDYVNVYHNTVNLTSNQTTDMAVYMYSSSYVDAKNNNLVIQGNMDNNATGYGFALLVNTGSNITADYNNIYSPGNYIAKWNGVVCENLDQLRTESGTSSNSISVFPAIEGADKVQSSSLWINGKGTALADVTLDINENPRDGATPDLGAFEFEPTLSPIPSGVYSVGFGGNYPSIDSVETALMKLGIAGPVTFEIKAGSTNNFHLDLKDIPGASPSDTIVFQSQSGDPSNTILTGDQSDAYGFAVRLNGTNYIKFQNLTFNAPGTTSRRIFEINGNAKDITIRNNVFNGITTSSDNAANYSIIYAYQENITDSLLIEGNHFVDNSYGIYLAGHSDFNHSNIKILNNTFDGQYNGIYLYRVDRPVIQLNSMMECQENGIYLNECDFDLNVTRNQIFSSQNGFIGIYLKYCDGSSGQQGLAANNFVGSSGSGYSEEFCMSIYQCSYQRVYFNSMMHSAENGAAMRVYNGNNINVANNIMVSNGTTAYAYKINGAGALNVSDYNNILSNTGYFVSYENTNYTTLADYQTAALLDMNSLNVDPVFTSDMNFHLLADSVVGHAIALADVPTDFDGETRDLSTPDIGADEFSCLFFPTPSMTDAEGCANYAIPPLVADGFNVIWYSDAGLTNEVWSSNEFPTGVTDPGTYTYYATQTSGECTSTADSATLTIYASPELSASIVNIDCQGTDQGAINLSVTGSTASPFIYNWSNDAFSEDIGELDAGWYHVTVDDLNGCTAIDSFQVTMPDPLVLNMITQDTECDTTFGRATVEVTSGEAPYQYQWTTGDTIPVIDSIPSGIYIVTVTDNRGCSKFALATINDIGGPEITVNSVVDVTCYGGTNGSISVDVTGGNVPYDYVWSNGATTQDVNNVPAGLYELIVEDGQGCQAIEGFEVSQPSPIDIDVNITDASCGQSNGAAIADVSGGVTPYSYSWSTGSSNDQISGLGIDTYNLTVTDDNSCTAIKYFSVSEIGAPTIVIDSINQGTCGDVNGAIYITPYGEYLAYEYLWSNGAETQDLINVNPGTYDVTVTDSSGCSGVKIATIEAEQPAPNPICMVTVDSASSENQVIWEAVYTEGVDHYKIYKEGSQSGVYYEVGTVDAGQPTLFVDQFSDVTQRSWRYKISVVDNCGVESELSAHHKTMHLTINLGVNNTINLIWDDYVGFDYQTCYIYRRSDIGWSLIDSVPSNLNSYTDQNPVYGESLYYMIEIKHPYGCDPGDKGNKLTSKSNVTPPVIPAPPGFIPPSVPEGLTTTGVTSSEVALIWNSSVDDVEVVGYIIYQNGFRVDSVGDTTVTISGLTPETSYLFEVSAYDNEGFESARSVGINVTTTGVGIDGFNAGNLNLNVYPNPAKTEVHVVAYNDALQNYDCQIYSVSGEIYAADKLNKWKGVYQTTFDISAMPPGIYIVEVRSQNYISHKRLIINK